MKIEHTPRGFEVIYLEDEEKNQLKLVQQSSRVGDYPDSWERPGSSALWVGECHLDREQVAEFIAHMACWLATGHLEMPVKDGVNNG